MQCVVHLNSFQKWAFAYAARFGYVVNACGNWVTLERGGVKHEVMSVQGVINLCL